MLDPRTDTPAPEGEGEEHTDEALSRDPMYHLWLDQRRELWEREIAEGLDPWEVWP